MLDHCVPMSRFARAFVALSAVACAAGCGAVNGKVRVDTARLQAVHKVAVVGVCSLSSYRVNAGLKVDVARAHWGQVQVGYEATAFLAALPAAWRGVDLVPPPSDVVSAEFKEGALYGTQTRHCVGRDPFDDKNNPDLPRLKQIAGELQVDAVLAVYIGPGVKSDGSKAFLFTDMGHPAQAYVVSANGEVVASASFKGAQSAEVEKLFSVGLVKANVRKVSDEEHQLMGTSLGQAVAVRLGAALAGNE